MAKQRAGKRKSTPEQRETTTARGSTSASDTSEESKAKSPSAEHLPKRSGTNIPVVGIGASAGGLDAISQLLSKVPKQNGLAFVLVPHLDPKHESLMADLLSKHTEMPVCEVRGPTRVQADHVYIVPPNSYMTLVDSVLQLQPRPENSIAYGEIDGFLNSLAEDKQELAIGIILSGTGQHGVRGLQEIKGVGGLVIVQDPTTAGFPSMPQAAVDAGVADSILAPEDMADVLLHFGSQARRIAKSEFAPQESQVHRILALLRAHTKYDFRAYRKKMVMRRVERRMGLNQVADLNHYIDSLRSNPDELRHLFQDLLIGVTEFFREQEAFEVLRKEALPKLIARSDETRPLRVWVPGCATGEEAYTLAILINEAFTAAQREPFFQIFATDIDERSLEKARRGIYLLSDLQNVTPERKRMYFTQIDEQRFEISKQLREAVVFASQNLISDPPFSKLDLVSCRNLLIYLEPDVQAKIIAVFHFSLNPDGYLLLGPSETIGRAVDRFEAVSAKWRLFHRKSRSRKETVEIPLTSMQTRSVRLGSTQAVIADTQNDLKRLAERMLLRNSPATVLVNRQDEILNYHGPTNRYLGNPSGPPTNDLFSLLLEGLRTTVRSAVYQAQQSAKVVVVEDARVKRDGKYQLVKVRVEPLHESNAMTGLLLISFEDADLAPQDVPKIQKTADAADTSVPAAASNDSALIAHLEFELKATREDLQGTIEEQESANEELKAANEEVTSMNEELQSANEELESSKEEMQSLNEELSTVNQQLEHKLQELELASNDITNLLFSLEMAIVFLDRNFQVRLFTPSARQLFSLRESDIGRPISELSQKSSDRHLLNDCQAVLDKLLPLEREIWTSDATRDASSDSSESSQATRPENKLPEQAYKRWYTRRVMPYRTQDNRIDGVVLSFIDITERKRAAQIESEARLYSEGIIETVRHPILVLDQAFRIRSANAAFYSTFDMQPEQTEGQLLQRIGQGQWNNEPLQNLLKGMVETNNIISDFVVEQGAADTGGSILLLNARIIHRLGERPNDILLAFEDVTERKQVERALNELNRDLEERVQERTEEIRLLSTALTHLGEGVIITDGDLEPPGPKIVFVNPAMCSMSGFTQQELIGKTPRILQGPNTSAEGRAYIRAELRQGKPCHVNLVNYRKDGTPYDTELYITPLINHEGVCTHFISVQRDITDRLEVYNALHVSEERVRSILDAAADAIVTFETDGTIRSTNPATEVLFGYRQEQLVGQDLRTLIPHPYRDQLLDAMRHHSQGVLHGKEMIGQRHDGTTFPVAVSSSQMDHLGLCTGIFRDVSERVALQKQILHIAAEENRRIGAELHDNTQQQLTGLGLLASNLAEQLQGDASNKTDLARRLASGIHEATRSVHSIARGLIPVEVDAQGLRAALAELANRVSKEYGLNCTFSGTSSAEIRDNSVATHLFRIAQEAINNAVKHGKASQIDISLEKSNGIVELKVLDNGTGIAEDPSKRSIGTGLQIIQYRAGLIGATFEIKANESGGTLLCCGVLQSESGEK